MDKQRDPRVQAIADKLARDCPYGSSETYKVGAPTSAADYHAARIAVKTLDEMAEYEYNIERTSLEHGTSHVQYHVWFSKDVAEDELSGFIEAEEIHEAEHGYRYATYRLVKRRKAGEVEDA